MARHATLSVDEAWNAVALEERLELVARAKGEGISAAVVFLLLIGSVAYGFDKIWLLAAGAGFSIFVMQSFSSHAWRRTKPQLILSYLAVRSMARRYAYGYKIEPLDIILIFRGHFQEHFRNQEEAELSKQKQQVDFGSTVEEQKDVWVCLLRGGVVMLSERTGGARLEFISAIGADTSIRRSTPEESTSENALTITASGGAKGRMAILTSDYPGALYVFERAFSRLVQEAADIAARVEKLRRS